MTAVYLVVGLLFAGGIGFAVYRIVRGPTILDRMIGSDAVLTAVVLILGADMVLRNSTETLPLLVVVAATSSFATIAVARYVTRRSATEDAEEEAEERARHASMRDATGREADEESDADAGAESDAAAAVDGSGPGGGGSRS